MIMLESLSELSGHDEVCKDTSSVCESRKWNQICWSGIVEFVFQCNLLQIDETLAGVTITSCPYFCEPSCFWFYMTIKITEEIDSGGYSAIDYKY